MNDVEQGILKELLTGGARTQPALATALNVNQSTVSRRLESLQHRGIVRHVGANKGYALVKSAEETVQDLTAPLLAEVKAWVGLLGDA